MISDSIKCKKNHMYNIILHEKNINKSVIFEKYMFGQKTNFQKTFPLLGLGQKMKLFNLSWCPIFEKVKSVI